jgi:hypothetical protein
VKGRVVALEAATEAELVELDRAVGALARTIHETEGTPIETILRFRPGPVDAVVVTVEEVYDQTPGPVAGHRLAPTPESA